ncbi:aspartate aminotransferase family protein [Planobispora longispora]|uniref:Glutamate-1-semialdehyde 2,1-aminomutase n=1 Tax=Planobispora longispora TaxID=28887 RepID=A0A8J3W6U8_9ACTN|nr:aminotransferase class III-fold pyridoxal phosphate-dependent enzyme [Planobispora longispora]GIH78167.1 glutamate-1-semialdehyde 2,1-aminomutase [Planobispora longispora]
MVSQWSASKTALDRAQRSIGGGVTSSVRSSVKPHQIYFASGNGPRIVDIEDNSYIDYVLGWGPLLLGHAHPQVGAAVKAQLDRGTLFGGGNLTEIVAAEKFLAALGWAERLLWSNTGTEAVQIALRLARSHTGRDVVIKLGGGYHGWHDTVFASVVVYGGGGSAIPHSAGQPASSLADLRVGLYNDLDACAALFAAEPGRVAAVLVDPTSSNTGSVVPAPGFLEGLRRLCDEHGALLIFDEVVSGLRLGLAGATGRFGVTPDLATFGKAIGGGLGASAVAGRADIIDLVTRDTVHSGTFNGNPLAMAAVDATMDVLSADGVYPQIENTSRTLVEGIRAAAAKTGHTIAVHGIGATALVAPGLPEITGPDDFITADWHWWDDLLVPEMLARGVYLLPHGRLFLSTEHGPAEVAETVAAFAEVFAMLPPPRVTS